MATAAVSSALVFYGANRCLTMAVTHEMLIKTFNLTTQLIRTLITSSETDHPTVATTLQDMDIEATTRTGEALIKELSQQTLERESIKVALRYLHRSIENLNKHLDALHKEIKDYSERWFRWARTPQTSDKMAKIQKEYNTMQSRLDMLIRLLQM